MTSKNLKNIKQCTRLFIYGCLLSSLLISFPVWSALHQVTNTSASGAGSLDAAVAAANVDGTALVQIGFDLPANSIINLQNPLYLQRSMTVSTSDAFAPGAPDLTIINPTGTVFLAGVRPNPSVSTVQIIFDGNNGINGLTVTGTSEGGVGGGAGLGGGLFVNQYTDVVANDTQFVNSSAQGGDGSPVPILTPATAGGHGGGGMQGGSGAAGGSGAGGGGGGAGLQFDGGVGGSDAGAGGGGGGGALGVPNFGGAGGQGADAAGSGGGGGGAGTISSPGLGGAGTGAAGGNGGGVVGGTGGAAGAANPGAPGTIGGGGGGGGAGANSPGGDGSILGGGGGGGAGADSYGGEGGAAGGGGGGGAAGVSEFGGDGGFGSGGGGGGAGANSPGGNGGFGGGGGGGGGGANSPGGNGGFGGGGGGGASGAGGLGGLGGFGGGNGEAGDTVPGIPGGGGGGAGFGGGVFVRGDDNAGVAGTFTSINTTVNTTWTGNTALAGTGAGGAGNGADDGQDLYLAHGALASFSVGNGLNQTFATVANTKSIGGAGGIAKNGLGNLILNAQSTYSGDTTLSAGILTLGDNTALGSGSLILNGGALQTNAPLNIPNNYSLTEASSLIGSNSFTLSGTGNVGNIVLTVSNTAGTITLSGIVSGNGGILQNGVGGSLLLSNANTYLGGTTITAGSLIVGNASALGTGTLTLNGGSLQSNTPLSIANNYVVSANSSLQGANDLTLSGLGNLQGSDLHVNQSAGIITLSNAISGTGGIVLDGNFLVLSGANSYTGGTTINAGTLQLGASNVLAPTGAVTVNAGIFDVNGTTQTIGDLSGAGNVTMGGGSLTFGTDTLSTIFSGVISGGGDLIKQNNGIAVLTGNNTFVGNTTINAGTLVVNGSLSGPVDVSPAGTLGGSGTIGGTVTNNGTVSPGSAGSFETLTILGDYNITPTGTTHITIDPQGQTSRITVLGTANIDGPLTMTAGAGSYVIGTRYTFLNASNVVGTFSSFPAQIGSFTTDVEYDPFNAVLVLITGTNFGSSLSTGNQNQQAVGAYLDSISANAGGDLAITLGALGLLSPQQLADALESISPGRLNAAVVVAEDNNVLINKINVSRLATLHCKNQSQNNLWVTPFGRIYNSEENDIDTGFTASTAGLTGGVDHQFFNNMVLGASIGRFQSRIDLYTFHDTILVNTNFATLYGSFCYNGYYADVSFLQGKTHYTATHPISYASINRRSKGQHHGKESSPHFGMGKDFHIDELTITPFVGIDHINVREEGYSLVGADSLDMDIQSKKAKALYSEIGARLSKSFFYQNNLLIPEAILSFMHKKVSNGDMVVGLFGQPGVFSVNNYSQTQNFIAPVLNVLAKNDNGGFIKATIATEFSSASHAYECNVSGGIAF